MYVAMSRVKFLDGLYFTGTYDKKAIKADKKAFAEYERMHQHCVLSPPETLGKFPTTTLSICLLNTRSLQLHVTDIACDKDIKGSDILCLTETQLSPDHDTSDISSKLDEFYISFNNDDDKFRRLLVKLNVQLQCIMKNFLGFL